MNAGIDYGMGQSNIDHETGIRYGVIPVNDLMPEAADDIFTQGEDVGYAAAIDEIKDSIEAGFKRVLEDLGLRPDDDDISDMADTIMQDQELHFESSGPYEYSGDGYQLRTMSDGTELFVLASPFYTRAMFCSPCAPGAGYLPSYCPDGPKTYCLGPDWFDKEGPPYFKIYRVDDDSVVYETPVVEE